MIKTIKSKMNQNGFSLIELMVVIVIMLILAGIAIPAFTGVVNDAKAAKATAEARSILMLAQMEADKGNVVDSTSTGTTAHVNTIKKIFEEGRVTSSTEKAKYKITTDSAGTVIVEYTDAVLFADQGGKLKLPEGYVAPTP